MTDLIRCQITYEKKYRNAQEYRTVPVVTCEEFDLRVTGDGFVVKQMAQALKEAGADLARPFCAFNGNKPAFTPVPLSRWTDPPDRRPDHLKRKGS